MPQYLQGDIFARSGRGSTSLTIVFGHMGFNELRMYWDNFRDGHSMICNVGDPFQEHAGRALEHARGHWLWFVAVNCNDGMTDSDLSAVLKGAVAWAVQNGVRFIVTNGVKGTVRAGCKELNDELNDRRALSLSRWAEEEEAQHPVKIALISLNDVYVRDHERRQAACSGEAPEDLCNQLV